MRNSPVLLSLLVSASLRLIATAQEPVVQQGILEVGDRLHIQAITPLKEVPGEVTVVKFGPRAWVLVEYNKGEAVAEGTPAGEAKAQTVQLWINFEHIIAVEKLPSPTPNPAVPSNQPQAEPKK